MTKLRETNWSFNDLFEKCIRNGVETWSDLYIYQFYGSCRSVYGANMTETLIEEIEYTNNFTSSALIKSCLNKGYKFPLIQDWINRLTSSSSLIDFKSEDGSRFELKFSALQQSATNEQRPFHLKLSNYDLASSVVWGRSEQSASQLKIWTPFDCYRQCLTVSNNAIFEKSKQTCSAFSFCTRQDRGAGKWQSTCKFSQTLVDKDETIDESFRSESVLAQDHCQLYQLDPLSQFKCPHTNRLLHEKSRQHQMSERIVNSVTDCAVACLSIAGCGSFTLIANETSREQRCTLLSANLIHFTDNDFEAKTFYNRKSIVCTFYTSQYSNTIHF